MYLTLEDIRSKIGLAIASQVFTLIWQIIFSAIMFVGFITGKSFSMFEGISDVWWTIFVIALIGITQLLSMLTSRSARLLIIETEDEGFRKSLNGGEAGLFASSIFAIINFVISVVLMFVPGNAFTLVLALFGTFATLLLLFINGHTSSLTRKNFKSKINVDDLQNVVVDLMEAKEKEVT